MGEARYENEPEELYRIRIAEKQADFIAKLFEDRDTIDLAKQRAILEELKPLQQRLGEAINAVCTVDERIALAGEAEALAKQYCNLPELPIARVAK